MAGQVTNSVHDRMQQFAKACLSEYSQILTHCRLNRFPHTIYWKSPISILGASGYEI